MATAQTEVPMTDDDLEALMAQLEEETADMIEKPTTTTVAATTQPAQEPEISDADLEALEPEDAVTECPVVENGDVSDADLEALAAEIEDAAPAAATAAPIADKTNKVAEKPVPKLAEAPAHPNPPTKKLPELRHYIDVEEFKGDIAVTENNLDNCMMQQAGLFAERAQATANAEAQHARAKLRFEVLEAKLYDRHRKALAAAGEKVTEKMVENAVKLDPEYVQAKNLVIEAETIASINKGTVEALRHRKDMIVQLGADRREDGKGQMRILEQSDLRARALSAVTKTAA